MGAVPVPALDDRSSPIDRGMAEVRVIRVEAGTRTERPDALAVEEPLEIRLGCELGGSRVRRSVSITMRTPGQDRELAVGFLFTEGMIGGAGDVERVRGCRSSNAIRVDLRAGVAVDLAKLERHFYTSSSCGVCGKASLEAVRVTCRWSPIPGQPSIDPAAIHRLPDQLRAAQEVFDRTGGLHASALFDRMGRLVAIREDVGRHNALDKLIGSMVLAGEVPLLDAILLVSGRASFELVQKAAVAGIPILAAVGAPSSLAVSLAEELGLTLLGFVGRDRFNIYTEPGRIRASA